MTDDMKAMQEEIKEQGGDPDILGFTIKKYTKTPEEFRIRIEFKNPLLISSKWENDAVTIGINENMMFSENTELDKINRKRLLKSGSDGDGEVFAAFQSFLPP